MNKHAECFECDNEESFPFKLIKSHRTNILGLDVVMHNGALRAVCPSCKHEYFAYPHLKEFTKGLAEHLVQRDLALNGKEVRFIRKYLGLSTEVFADRLDYTRETISRIENSTRLPERVVDLATRQLFHKMGGKPDRDYDKHDREIARKSASKRPIQIKMGKMSLAYA